MSEQTRGNDGRVRGAERPDGRTISGAEEEAERVVGRLHKNREDLLALLRDGNSDLSCPPALSFRNADGWAERKIVHQDGFDVFAVAASEQTPLSEHFHPRHDQYIWVMSGRMRLTRKDEEHELEAGSAVAIPSKTTHSILPLVESSMMTMYRPPATGEPPDPDVLTPMIPEA